MFLLVLFSAPVPAQAVTIHDDYPALINDTVTVTPNGQFFGRQICPIEQYNAANPAAVIQNRQEYGLIKRMVYCVQGLVIPATYKIMYQNSINYFYGPIAAAMTLAVVLWGVLMVTGKNSAPRREAFVVFIKIGAVSLFTFVLGQSSIWPYGLFPVIIAVVDDLAAVVTNYIGYSSTMACAKGLPYWDLWAKVDCALLTLFGGFFDPAYIVTGLIGFFVSALFSGPFGLFIALIGFATIYYLIMAIFRAVYITITAYIALALMAIVSPIFITLILFRTTYGYFEKWVKLTIGFMLQPMFLFAYLAMMLAAYDTVIYSGKFSVYRALVGETYIGSYPNPLRVYPAGTAQNPSRDFQLGRWLLDSGVYRDTKAAAVGVSVDPRMMPPPEARNTGVLGSTGATEVSPDLFERRDTGGMVMNVLESFVPINVYNVYLPMKRVGWRELALSHMCTAPNCTIATIYNQLANGACNAGMSPEACQSAIDSRVRQAEIDYLIQLMLSLLLAMLTMYLFYLMLDALPFIGAGISGGAKESMPVLGTNGLSMPGSNLLDKLKSNMGKLAGGG